MRKPDVYSHRTEMGWALASVWPYPAPQLPVPGAGRDPGLVLHRVAENWVGSHPQHTYLGTSIFRPSTIVPFSFSRARSASELVSKVTNPKPCEQRRTDTGRHRMRRRKNTGVGAGQGGEGRGGERGLSRLS